MKLDVDESGFLMKVVLDKMDLDESGFDESGL